MREEINELVYISLPCFICSFYDSGNNGIRLRLWTLTIPFYNLFLFIHFLSSFLETEPVLMPAIAGGIFPPRGEAARGRGG